MPTINIDYSALLVGVSGFALYRIGTFVVHHRSQPSPKNVVEDDDAAEKEKRGNTAAYGELLWTDRVKHLFRQAPSGNRDSILLVVLACSLLGLVWALYQLASWAMSIATRSGLTAGIVMKATAPQTCADDPAWTGINGRCSTYARGGFNEGWCNEDLAAGHCSVACGTCAAYARQKHMAEEDNWSVEDDTVDCVDDLAWNGGSGGCDTYAPGGFNAGWCETDLATEHCPATCGSCSPYKAQRFAAVQ